MSQIDFKPLYGKRVGLVTNHTALVAGKHLIDILHENPKIELTALFGPEHGLRGLADAGEKVSDSRDPTTGIPVFSLYGKQNRPTLEQLKSVDVLIFDIQDVGARFYTYISTLGLCMQSAAEADIPFYVFDRPNPLGGEQVSGFVLEHQHTSFVGQYPIPIQHGLTIGELARMIKGQKMLPGLEKLDLRVAPCQNWKRDMLWTDFAQEWKKTSPNIPDFNTALIYPGTCLFEAVQASEGRGTNAPFRTLGAPNIDSNTITRTLNHLNLKGVTFQQIDFTPVAIPGMSAEPKFKNQALAGIRIEVTNPREVQPVELGIYLLHTFYHALPSDQQKTFFKPASLNRLAGTDRLQTLLESGATPEQIISSWKQEVEAFKALRTPYLLYK